MDKRRVIKLILSLTLCFCLLCAFSGCSKELGPAPYKDAVALYVESLKGDVDAAFAVMPPEWIKMFESEGKAEEDIRELYEQSGKIDIADYEVVKDHHFSAKELENLNEVRRMQQYDITNVKKEKFHLRICTDAYFVTIDLKTEKDGEPMIFEQEALFVEIEDSWFWLPFAPV